MYFKSVTITGNGYQWLDLTEAPLAVCIGLKTYKKAQEFTALFITPTTTTTQGTTPFSRGWPRPIPKITRPV
jgi:hypothetical protein